MNPYDEQSNNPGVRLGDDSDEIEIDVVKNDTGGPSSASTKNTAFIKIIEQPAAVVSVEFRQPQSAKTTTKTIISGVHSTPENKTFPTIRLVGTGGRAAVVVVSCVTKSRPFRPHPHNVAGRENCKRGICTVLVDNESMTESFRNLEIRQCAAGEEDVRDALRLREAIRVDPFKTGFSHRDYSATSIDLNAFRLCFQAFLRSPTNGKFVTLEPVVSDIIYNDKNSRSVPSRNNAWKVFDRPPPSNYHRETPYVEIIEQPAAIQKDIRRACASVSAARIVGANSTPENKTYPTIRLVGSGGGATVVVVSCVTRSRPYRPHPHNVVGRENCKRGVCTIVIDNESMTESFLGLGIQCAKREDIHGALRVREQIRVDPFRTGFSHGHGPTSTINLNEFRLCFQGFLKSPGKGKFIALAPVVSDPICYNASSKFSALSSN